MSMSMQHQHLKLLLGITKLKTNTELNVCVIFYLRADIAIACCLKSFLPKHLMVIFALVYPLESSKSR